MLYSKVGERVRQAGQDMLRTVEGEAGCVLFGPYQALLPGHYEVDFRILPARRAKSPCASVDVFSTAGDRTLAWRELKAADLLAAEGRVTLPFEVTEAGEHEFRVFAHGNAGLRVGLERPFRRVSGLPADAAGLLEGDLTQAPAFFRTHLAVFHDLRAKAFTFRLDAGNEVVARYEGFSFTLRNPEDVQLLGEVFLLREYNFLFPGEAVAIDIGMNIGFAALFLARAPAVTKVYAFEPFRAPFARAQANIALNPALAAKIEAHPFALSDHDGTATVLTSPDETIGVSIAGRAEGVPETIIVRDAAAVLAPVIAEARAARRLVVMKIDCEGSEFAIFQRLRDTGLIDDVAMIVCEWHKWWDRTKTQFDLIDPLLARGFVAIDRTDPSDPHAGLIYLVRFAPPAPPA